jgi:hypothetical protein
MATLTASACAALSSKIDWASNTLQPVTTYLTDLSKRVTTAFQSALAYLVAKMDKHFLPAQPTAVSPSIPPAPDVPAKATTIWDSILIWRWFA